VQADFGKKKKKKKIVEVEVEKYRGFSTEITGLKLNGRVKEKISCKADKNLRQKEQKHGHPR
jgi:hypothetical protein